MAWKAWNAREIQKVIKHTGKGWSKMAMQRWVSSNQGENLKGEGWQKNKSIHVNSGDITAGDWAKK